MKVKTGIVNRFLAFAEFSIHRNSAGQIGIITSISCSKIHQYQLSVPAFLVVAYVMERTGPVATGYNASISFSTGSLAEKGMNDLGFDLVLHNPGPDKTHDTQKGIMGDFNGLLGHFYFHFSLD